MLLVLVFELMLVLTWWDDCNPADVMICGIDIELLLLLFLILLFTFILFVFNNSPEDPEDEFCWDDDCNNGLFIFIDIDDGDI